MLFVEDEPARRGEEALLSTGFPTHDFVNVVLGYCYDLMMNDVNSLDPCRDGRICGCVLVSY